MKLMIGLLAAAIVGTGGFAFAAGLDETEPARTVSLPAASTIDNATNGATRNGATTTDDIGTGTAPTPTTTDEIVIGSAPAATTNSVDISGPCDEAEHANDPRCTGAVDGDDDRNDDRHDDRDDDNSGPGSGGDDDRSGPDRGSDHDNDD